MCFLGRDLRASLGRRGRRLASGPLPVILLASMLAGKDVRAAGDAIPQGGSAGGHLYGILQMTDAHAAKGRSIGMGVAVMAVGWDRLEPSRGHLDEDYIAEILRRKSELSRMGYRLMLDPGIQYPPGWIFDAPGSRYMNQYGETFADDQPGGGIPNVVFSGAVRARLAEYLHAVFSRLGCDWDFVRLGGSRMGELNYPGQEFRGRSNCYWAFDDQAQGRSHGLQPGLRPCPVPGWIPGESSDGHRAARAFADWYLECLLNYQDWQILTVRKDYQGDICLLYGGWGIRPGGLQDAVAGDLCGATPVEKNGEIQQGCDWALMINAIRDPRVIVYCTWLDGTLNNRNLADDTSTEISRWSPAKWQAWLAAKNPLHPRVWGENTGENSPETMRLVFEKIRSLGLMGVVWAFDRDLFAATDPQRSASIDDFAALIRENL